MNSLIPMYLNALKCQQSDDPEDDDWTVSRCVAASLRLLSIATREKIIPLVVKFVEQNINEKVRENNKQQFYLFV